MNKNNEINEIKKEKELQKEEDQFIEILHIGQSLKQLHVIGEVFAENGFLQRSDERTKTDIANLQNSLDMIMQLRGVSFKYKGTDQKKFGFIAQELKEVFPDLVREDETGLFIDTHGILPILVEALKQLYIVVEDYKIETSEIAELTKRVDNAMDHLNKIKNEEYDQENNLLPQSKEPNQEKQEYDECDRRGKSNKSIILERLKTLLGPPPFILFSFLFSLFFLIVVSIIFRSFYFIIIFFALSTPILFFSVAFNWKDIRLFIIEGKSFIPSFVGWESYQFKTWFIIFSIFMNVLFVSLVMGQYVFIMIVLYTVVIFISFAFISFVHRNVQKYIPSQILIIPMILIQAIGIALLILSVIYQPFNEFNPMKMDIPKYELTISQNTEVNIELVPIAWNCFNPQFTSEPELPKGLSFVFNEQTKIPYIQGKVQSIDYGKQSDIDLDISLICSSYIVIKYPLLHVNNCNNQLDSSECKNSHCSYCIVESNQLLNHCFVCNDKGMNYCNKIEGNSTCKL